MSTTNSHRPLRWGTRAAIGSATALAAVVLLGNDAALGQGSGAPTVIQAPAQAPAVTQAPAVAGVQVTAPATTVPAPSVAPSVASVPASVAGVQIENQEELELTGSNSAPMLAVGAAATAVGAVLISAARRRRSPQG
jgi:hypothetical protein